MTPERWKRTEELYYAAIALPPGERERFLVEACRDDEALRRDVESLLNEAASGDGFLDPPALVMSAHLASDLAPMTGQSLGGYRLEALLGAGGMGEVYRARDPRLGRDVAIKILPRAFTSNPDRLARFEREARMLAALNHPNICAIYGVEEADGRRFLILELVNGETLAQKLADVSRGQSGNPGLPLREALPIARQVAEALEAAHEEGIVHRDLKPANINVTPDGVVKVLDFGLAKPVGGDGMAPGLTQAPAGPEGGGREGAVIGTAAYMSPEQARGLPVDKRTDIWAFGCVFYEMLTGRVAFAGETVSDSIARILEREPDWSALSPATPLPIRRLLLRCLTKDPKQRFRDIGDVRIELDAIDEVLPGTSERTGGAAAPARTRAAWLPWMALAALALAVAIRETTRPVAIEDPLANARFTPLTYFEGSEGGAEISPDGRFVTFIGDESGEPDLWQTQVDTDEFKNLTPDIPPLTSPGILRSSGFSPNGADVWFGALAGPNRRMPLNGGPVRQFLVPGARTPAWSPDGNRLVYFDLSENERDSLYLADRMGGDAKRIDIRPSDVNDWSGVADSRAHTHNPVWSLDEWIYFTHGAVREWNQQADEMDIWRIRPSGGSPERLTNLNTDVTFLAPIDARTLLYTARAADGSGPWLWSLDVPSRSTRRIITWLDQITSVSASRDGTRVVVTRAKPSARLWTVPILERPSADRDVQPFPVQTDRAVAPRYGGTSLFYLSARGTGDGLWAFREGKSVEILKGVEGPVFEAPAPSLDGRRVAVSRKREGKHVLTTMLANGTDVRTLAPTIDTSGAAEWSPDDKWIATGGIDAGGRRGLFIIPVDGEAGAGPIRLADGEASNPVWLDGKTIVYSGEFARGQVPLLAVRTDRTTVQLPSIRVSPGGYCFLPGKGLVYLERPESVDFWLLDLDTGKSRQLTSLSNKGAIRGFDITPDGTHIIFDRTQQNSDIVLIELPKR